MSDNDAKYSARQKSETQEPETQDPQRRFSFFRGGCKGCQACVELMPECFEWDDDEDKPILKHDCAQESRIRECMSYCPEDCIELEDD